MSPQWTDCCERWARVDVSWLPKIPTKNDLAVFLALCSRANGKNRDAWPSKATIAKDADIAPEDVRRSLRELEKIGAIETSRRFLPGTSEQTSSAYVIQKGAADSRFAFVAAPWIARIETLNALRLFVALCSCANHETSQVRGYSRSGLAKIAGFHESAVTKALPYLLQIGAVRAEISTTGRRTVYHINSPPEAWAAARDQEWRLERREAFAACVARYRGNGATFHVMVERGVLSIRYGGIDKRAFFAVNYDIEPFIGDLPWCMIYDVIGSGDGTLKVAKKAA